MIDVAVGAQFKASLYSCWALWMMEGAFTGKHKVQPKSGNRICADFLEILKWNQIAWDEVKSSTILQKLDQCYMRAEPGPEIEVEYRDTDISLTQLSTNSVVLIVD